jgi:antitoxin (DNA-binding transcriptional repressor) of toxin-antitoxin stability system
MKFVTVRDFRTHSTKMWQQLKDEDEIVITLSGKPVALLTSLSEDTVEETLQFVRQAKAMAAIHSMQMRSASQKNNEMSLAEINHEIAAARKARVP